MQTFEYKVKIKAQNPAEAKRILAALFKIKKAVTTDDLMLFSDAIEKDPGLVKKAKYFI
jgi:hypothetical protein